MGIRGLFGSRSRHEVAAACTGRRHFFSLSFFSTLIKQTKKNRRLYDYTENKRVKGQEHCEVILVSRVFVEIDTIEYRDTRKGILDEE